MSRAVFEAWIDAQGEDTSRHRVGYYNSEDVELQWEAWQAAEKATAARCAEICERAEIQTVATKGREGEIVKLIAIPDDGKEYVLVPREPTTAMLVDAVKERHGQATYRCVSASGCVTFETEARADYEAMLSAAPPVKVFELPERDTRNPVPRLWNDLLDEIERRAK